MLVAQRDNRWSRPSREIRRSGRLVSGRWLSVEARRWGRSARWRGADLAGV